MARGRFGDGISWRARREERPRSDDPALRMELRVAVVRLKAARLFRLVGKANFDLSQPRVPRGEPGGGRWTDGGVGTSRPSKRPTGEPIRLAQAQGGRGRATPTLRLPGGIFELSPGQAARYDAARIRAEIEIARLRSVSGNENWKPPAGLYETVEGAIRHQRAIGDAAIAYRYGRIGHNSRNTEPLLRGDMEPFVPGTAGTLTTNGVPLGFRYNRASENVYTLDQNTFDNRLADLLRGRKPMPTPASYADKGYWIELADRCIVGIRWSKDNGLTIEIIRSSVTGLPKNSTKVHRERKDD